MQRLGRAAAAVFQAHRSLTAQPALQQAAAAVQRRGPSADNLGSIIRSLSRAHAKLSTLQMRVLAPAMPAMHSRAVP